MYYVARIMLIWFLCLLSVFLHESGHALGCRITAGKMDWKILVGSGPRILSIAKKYTFFLIPAGGYFAPEEELRTKKAKVTMLAGGPLFSLLLSVLFFCICRFSIFGLTDPESELYRVLFPVFSFLFYFNLFKFNELSTVRKAIVLQRFACYDIFAKYRDCCTCRNRHSRITIPTFSNGHRQEKKERKTNEKTDCFVPLPVPDGRHHAGNG